ncbi:MAG TPA: fibronectin type III domain-containing protein, partial [Patescibacteria group bacterium]
MLVIFIIAGQSLKADTVGTEVFIVPFLPVPTPLGPAPDRHPPVIFNVFIKNVTFDGATITWNTNEKARTVFHYGLTQQYGQGSIINDQFLTSHQVILSDLFSNKTYHFQIVAFDKNNNQTTSDDYFFETLEVVDDIPPGNIRVFDSEVTADNQAIRLTWLNPPDEDLRGIKIQRR